MKTNSFAALLLVFHLLTLTGWADDIREADYPVHYEVLSASKTDKLVIQKICSMTLRDQADADVTFTVSKTGFGPCPVLNSGKVYNGRRNEKKNEIELVIPVGEDKARVVSWHVNSIVHASSSSQPPSARLQ